MYLDAFFLTILADAFGIMGAASSPSS